MRADAPDLPLVEHLQRRGARAPQAGGVDRVIGRHPGGCGRLAAVAHACAEEHRHLDRGGRRFPSLVLPARRPRAPPPAPTVSVVNTPNAIGTPVSPDACWMPCATDAEMYSKCAVAPRMTHPGRRPRRTARFRRRRGPPAESRMRPARDTTSTSPAAAPASASAALAPSRSLSVMAIVEPRHDDGEAKTCGALAAGPGAGIGMSHVLFSLEHRFALLEKRAGPFPHVVGARHETEERRFEHLRRRQRQVEPCLHGVNDVACREWRFCRERRGQRDASRIRSAAGTTLFTSPMR